MKDFGYETLISILLPGSILFASAWLLVDQFLAGTLAGSFIAAVARSEWQFGIVLLLGSALLGTLLSSLTDILEWRVFDRRTARRLQIDAAQYDEEWYCYVESLKGEANTYLTRKTVYYYFETRAGLAVLTFAIVWLVSTENLVPRLTVALSSAACAAILLFISSQTHALLGFWRHRLFGPAASRNLQNREEGDNAERKDTSAD